jgi:hypothetical protein
MKTIQHNTRSYEESPCPYCTVPMDKNEQEHVEQVLTYIGLLVRYFRGDSPSLDFLVAIRNRINGLSTRAYHQLMQRMNNLD